MANVNLPTPVVVAGGALCLLGGYLLGVVTGPDTPDRTTGVVESFDEPTNRICLSGETVSQHEAAQDGELCGTWRRSAGSSDPEEGDEFRYVAVLTSEAPEADDTGLGRQVVIYGDVVD